LTRTNCGVFLRSGVMAFLLAVFWIPSKMFLTASDEDLKSISAIVEN